MIGRSNARALAAALAAALLVLAAAACRATAGESAKLTHAGLERTYALHVPAGLEPGKRVPLVIVLHGGRGTGEGMVAVTRGGFDALADRDRFVVAYPDGVESHWNDGRGNEAYRAQRENIDDVGFLRALVDASVRDRSVDPARVFVAGISNGAMMAHRFAIEAPTRVAAIAAIAGSIPAALTRTAAATAAPPCPVAVLAINGDEDPLVPVAGGQVHFFGKDLGLVLSVDAVTRFWTQRNGDREPPTRRDLPDADPKDGTRVRETRHPGPGEVVLLTIEGGGHTWPSGVQYLPEMLIGRTTRDIDGCAVIWAFFKAHGRPEPVLR